MEKLPLRPLLFVPAYLLLAVISAFLGPAWLDAPIFWSTLFGTACFALHFAWTFRALAFVSKRLPSGQHSAGLADPLRTARRFLLVMIISLAAGISYKLYLEPAVLSGTSFGKPLETLLAFITVFHFFGVFWIAARAVCDAELGRRAPAHSAIGTFLLFVYIVIGAPFIYRRLRKLQEQTPSGTAVPA